MYKSPITIIESTIDSIYKDIVKKKDDAIFAEIQSSFGVDLDRGELIRALQYDRDQYQKGYQDGQPKWIPVTERLPEEYENVLVCSGGYVEPGWIGGDRVFYTYDKYESDIIDDVTHWMPLPEPPKGE